MFFVYGEKKYEVDVQKALDMVNIQEDYFSDLEEDGVAVKEFDGKEDFNDCEAVALFYNPAADKATIQLCKDDYEIIPVEITCDELKLLRDFFE